MTPEEIEKDLIEACDKAIAMGWKITPGVTHSARTKCCCALGALRAIDPKAYPFQGVAQIGLRRYGLHGSDIAALISAFDDRLTQFTNGPFFQIGLRLREKYIK